MKDGNTCSTGRRVQFPVAGYHGKAQVDEASYSPQADMRAGFPSQREGRMMRARLPFFLAMIALVTLFGCGKGSSPGANTSLSVALTQVPPAQIGIGQTAILIATVTNDPTDSGVTWGVSCGAAKCGSLSPTSTLSGAATTYVAPSAVPTGNTVNVTATSVADTSQKVTVTITISVATQQVSIAFSEAPPSTININQQVMVAATVTDDPTNAGVDWTVTCGGGSACGSFNPPHTSSGATTTYTAPSSVPNGNVVNIIATATADPMVSVTSTPTIFSTAVAVTITSTIPSELTVATTLSITATVANDLNDDGVNWTVTCGSADCGSFSPTQTGDGVATTYTAPAAVPTGIDVTIIATSIIDPKANATAVIPITTVASLNSLLKGQYAISFTGTDTNGFYAVAGSLGFDGNGSITGGEEDFLDLNSFTQYAQNLAGVYQIGSDGLGTMYIYNNDNLGIGCTTCGNYTYEQIISFELVDSTRSLVSEFDYSATSSGSLDIQTTSDFTQGSISGGYSFIFSGIDTTEYPKLQPAAFGGVFTANGTGGAFTGGTEDINDNGKVTLNSAITGNFSAPDSFGRVSTASFDDGNYTFVFYIVNSGELKFLETDTNTLVFESFGTAYTQGSGTLGNGALSGNYVFTGLGNDGTGPRAEGGFFHANGGGTLSSGVIDVNNNGTPTSDASFSGSYSISDDGRGTFTISPSAGGITDFEVYETATAGPLFLETDSGSVSSGSGILQNGAISFSGDYAVNYTAPGVAWATETDLTGQLIATGGTTLNGTGNINQWNLTNPVETPNITLTGTFTGGPSNGRFPGTLVSTPPGSQDEVYYVAGPNTVLFVAVGGGTSPAVGILQLQNLQTQ